MLFRSLGSCFLMRFVNLVSDGSVIKNSLVARVNLYGDTALNFKHYAVAPNEYEVLFVVRCRRKEYCNLFGLLCFSLCCCHDKCPFLEFPPATNAAGDR